MRSISGFLLVSLFLLLACSKKSGGESDSQPPVVTIATPVNSQLYTAGQSISITGNITDDQFIAEVHIHVTNNNTGELLMDVHLYPAASSTAFNQSITAVAGVAYKIQVIAKDRAVNEGRQSVLVTCN